MTLQLDALDILLVEDDSADVRLTKEALKDAKVGNKLYVVGDGVEAMAFLRRDEHYRNAPRPDLILLDLNLPKKDGREVLQEIKSDAELMNIPVVILTTSELEEDILQTYGLRANAYVVKPVGLHEFASVVKSIDDFWLAVVKLPRQSKHLEPVTSR